MSIDKYKVPSCYNCRWTEHVRVYMWYCTWSRRLRLTPQYKCKKYKSLKHNSIMDFKEAYKFPLHVSKYGSACVMTADDEVAFVSFLGNGEASVKALQEIVGAINGERPGIFDASVYGDQIFIGGAKVLLVGGLTRLTDFEGLDLSPEEATRTQSEFANYCVQQLRRDLEGTV